MLVAPWTVNIEETIISQYANSPTLLALINNMNQYIDPQANLFNFYNQIWNVNSATGYGLDLWGRIVGVSRTIFTNQSSSYFNWYETTIGTKWGPGGNSPWLNGAFGTGTTNLLDPIYRTVILAKALANISICTPHVVNTILTALFGPGVYVSDLGNMQMQINVTTTLTNIQLAILNFANVIPRPAGVQMTVNYSSAGATVTGVSSALIPTMTGHIGSVGNVTGTVTAVAFKIVGAMSGIASSVGGSTVVTLSNSTAYAGIANTVNTGGSVLITANVTGLANTTVTWRVDGVPNGNSTVGTINTGTAMGTANQWGNTVLYTAPAGTGSHSIVAYANDGTPSLALSMSVQTKAYNITNSTAISVHAPSGNATTDTGYINTALATASSGGGGVVTLATGTYNVTGVSSGGEYVFNVPSNTTVVIPTGCTVSMSGAPSGGQAGIFNVASSNVNIVGGGTITGNNIGSNTACVFIQGASNVCVAGLTLTGSSSGYDGITIEGYWNRGLNVTAVLVYGCTINANNRNGVSPCGEDGFVIRDCTLNGNKTNPAAGIDFEPTNNGAYSQRCTISYVFNNIMNSNTDGGNYGGAIQSGPDDGNAATMSGLIYAFNSCTGNSCFGIEVQNASNIQILNNTVNGTTTGLYGGPGILLRGATSAINTALILGNSLSSNAGGGIVCSGSMSGVIVEYNAMHGQSLPSNGGGVTVANNT
jgi:parallel beta-helix repeat protein